MTENQQYIDTLNQLLKGEFMAIRIYNQTKGTQGDEQVYHMLYQFETDHRRHARQLADRIKHLGGEPEISTGAIGFMANVTGKINSLRGPKHLLQQVYDGEAKGVHAYEDRVDELDSDSQQLVRKLIQEDHDHLRLFKERMKRRRANIRYTMLTPY